MNYLSVCSGIEAATVAWHDLGWKPLGFSEIEKFPSEVLAHHYPNTPNLGDMTKYKEWDFGSNRLDLLVGGTPCQSFSVAGLRKGLDDPRGNLALTYVGILDKFRPKWCLWENVPGVLSSNGGRDFGAFLGALVELGYGFAYRVLDAQNFGVPQRRRRVFVVGCLGDWKSAAKVLFESESLSGNIAKSRSSWKETTTVVGVSTQLCGPLTARDYKGISSDDCNKRYMKMVATPKIANCLETTCNDYSRADGFTMIVYENHPSDSRVKEMGETCQTVTSRWGTGGGNVPLFQTVGFTQCDAARDVGIEVSPTLRSGGSGGYPNHSVSYGIQGSMIGRSDSAGPMYTLNATGVHGIVYSFDSLSSNSMKSSNPLSGCNEVKLSKTLDTSCLNPSANQGGIAVVQKVYETHSADRNDNSPHVAFTLSTTQDQQIAFVDVYNYAIDGNVSATMTEACGGTNTSGPKIMQNMIVRKLTPIECERLQGFPDNYTDIQSNGKPTPDGSRYKAMGNSMAVPVMRWIGKRIANV